MNKAVAKLEQDLEGLNDKKDEADNRVNQLFIVCEHNSVMSISLY